MTILGERVADPKIVVLKFQILKLLYPFPTDFKASGNDQYIAKLQNAITGGCWLY